MKADDKNNTYKLIKQKHIFPAIMGLLIAYCIVAILAVIITNTVLDYLCETKFETEYDSIKYMAGLYDTSPDKENIKTWLGKDSRDFIIIDKDKTVLFAKGNNSCDMEKNGLVSNSATKGDIKIYFDKNNTDTLFLNNKSLVLDVKNTIGEISNHNVFGKLFSSEDDDSDLTIPLYFWISIDLSDGSGSFIGKAAYEIKTRDMAIVFLFAAILALTAIILFVTLMGRIIRKFSRQNKLLSVFFTDVVTKGHNWMWFTIKGAQFLKKKKNDKLNYAILNISTVKYNTFCVCHSVEEGEQVLQAINKMISKSINKYEACAHHGTSSFAVLMQYANEDLLKKKVKFILRHLENVDPNHKFAFHVGIALLPAKMNPNGSYERRKDIDIEKVYNDACAASATLDMSDDSAIAFFDDKLVEEQRWIDIVNEKQQQALNNEEFLIYYQPKYNPSTNELRGAEALIRWQSPEYGFVTPGRFIPIFEKNGFITEIDHYMLTHVARDQRRWLDQGFKCVPVSVNVSRAHFIESDLAEQIRDAVDNEGAPRDMIEIELTESAFFDDKKALIGTIEKLKGYGFSVSMDDFGAGYSSLNSLKDMPLDVLKLDADFFRGETEGNRGEIVVSEAIRLAKALNMRTVAEGVEIKEQVDFLAKQGCDMIQGYYYAKPMTGSDYEQRMGRGSGNSENSEPKPAEIEIVEENLPELADQFLENAEDNSADTENILAETAVDSSTDDIEKISEEEPAPTLEEVPDSVPEYADQNLDTVQDNMFEAKAILPESSLDTYPEDTDKGSDTVQETTSEEPKEGSGSVPEPVD